MLTTHRILAFLVVGVPALASLGGGFVYWRRRGVGRVLTNLLALAFFLVLGACAYAAYRTWRNEHTYS